MAYSVESVGAGEWPCKDSREANPTNPKVGEDTEVDITMDGDRNTETIKLTMQ